MMIAGQLVGRRSIGRTTGMACVRAQMPSARVVSSLVRLVGLVDRMLVQDACNKYNGNLNSNLHVQIGCCYAKGLWTGRERYPTKGNQTLCDRMLEHRRPGRLESGPLEASSLRLSTLVNCKKGKNIISRFKIYS